MVDAVLGVGLLPLRAGLDVRQRHALILVHRGRRGVQGRGTALVRRRLGAELFTWHRLVLDDDTLRPSLVKELRGLDVSLGPLMFSENVNIKCFSKGSFQFCQQSQINIT